MICLSNDNIKVQNNLVQKMYVFDVKTKEILTAIATISFNSVLAHFSFSKSVTKEPPKSFFHFEQSACVTRARLHHNALALKKKVDNVCHAEDASADFCSCYSRISPLQLFNELR